MLFVVLCLAEFYLARSSEPSPVLQEAAASETAAQSSGRNDGAPPSTAQATDVKPLFDWPWVRRRQAPPPASPPRRRRRYASSPRRRRRFLADPTPSVPPHATPSPTPSQPIQADSCVDLLVIGDYGTRDHHQADVAAGLASVAAAVKPIAIAAVGDNIYGVGAEGNPQTIVDWWSAVYLKYDSLHLPWYVVTGNHDWYTDARVERDFTHSSRNTGGWWKMPSFWYKRSFVTNSSGTTIDAFFIDTQIWKGSSLVYEVLGPDAKDQQIAWLTGELESSVADWKIIFGHHPVYSAGSHGITDALLAELDPLMRRHGVQLLFSGHDHSKQLMQYRGMNYVISGAGGAKARTRSDEYPAGSQRHFLEDFGFAGISICNKSSATLRFYHESGHVQAAVTIMATPPDPTAETGRPALANGVWAAEAKSNLCGGITMRDVDTVCPSTDGSACKVLAEQTTQKSCRAYCSKNGLGCIGGWEEQEENCVPSRDIGCDHAFGSISDLICECAPSVP